VLFYIVTTQKIEQIVDQLDKTVDTSIAALADGSH